MKLFSKFVLLFFLVPSYLLLSQSSSVEFRNYLSEKKYEEAGALGHKVLSENPGSFELASSVGDVFYELEE